VFIYLLTKKNKVVYVGKTNNLKRRIKEHKGKCFDGYLYTECQQDNANSLEDEFITYYDPIYNNSLNSKGEYKNLIDFCEEKNLDLNKIRYICENVPYIQPVFNENYHPYVLNMVESIYREEELADGGS